MACARDDGGPQGERTAVLATRRWSENQAGRVLEQVAFDPAGKPFEWRVRRAVTDNHRYIDAIH